MVVNGGKGAKASGLKIALVIDMTTEVIKDPLNGTRVGEERKTVLERQSVRLEQHRFDPSPVPLHK